MCEKYYEGKLIASFAFFPFANKNEVFIRKGKLALLAKANLLVINN